MGEGVTKLAPGFAPLGRPRSRTGGPAPTPRRRHRVGQERPRTARCCPRPLLEGSPRAIGIACLHFVPASVWMSTPSPPARVLRPARCRVPCQWSWTCARALTCADHIRWQWRVAAVCRSKRSRDAVSGSVASQSESMTRATRPFAPPRSGRSQGHRPAEIVRPTEARSFELISRGQPWWQDKP